MNLATTFQDKQSEMQKKIMAFGLSAAIAFTSALNATDANAETQQVNHSPAATQTAPDDDVMDAANYAKKHNTVTVWVCIPPDLPMTAEQLGEMMEKKFQSLGINEAKAFSAVSESKGSRIIIFVGDEPYINPTTGARNFDLHNIKGEIAAIKAAYDAKNSTASIEEPSVNINTKAGRGLKPRP